MDLYIPKLPRKCPAQDEIPTHMLPHSHASFNQLPEMSPMLPSKFLPNHSIIRMLANNATWAGVYIQRVVGGRGWGCRRSS